jgi:hypothetical protein
MRLEIMAFSVKFRSAGKDVAMTRIMHAKRRVQRASSQRIMEHRHRRPVEPFSVCKGITKNSPSGSGVGRIVKISGDA